MRYRRTETSNKSNRSRRASILSLLAGVLVVALGTLVVMNMVASKADGASTESQGDDAAAAETTENEQSSDETAKDESEGETDDKGKDEKAPVPVEVADIRTGSVSAYISSTANLVAEFEVKVLSEVEGRVLSLQVEEGDLVRKGQVLATLVPDDEQISVKKAELKASNARLAYERAKDLVDKELISREEFDKLEIDFGIAEQELAEAQWALSRTSIRAPFTGRVTERMTQAGQHVQVGEEMFQVTDFDPLIARIYLPERDVIGLTEGREVRIRLNAAEQVAFSGRIRQISPIVDTATGTVKITVEALESPTDVRPGSFVTVDIVRETRAATLLVPREAVLRELQKAHVFVATDDIAEKRAITLGLEEGDFIEALTGVKEGETVIVAGQGGLRDGSPVKILGAPDSAS
jgi:membrane fusion protein (multidrug efflux system)